MVVACRPNPTQGTNVGEVDELEMEFLESTSVRNWMEMWLRALSDHVRLVSDSIGFLGIADGCKLTI